MRNEKRGLRRIAMKINFERFKKFNKILSFEPDNIRLMTLNQKRDCMDEINNRRKFAARYSVLFLFGAIVYYFLKNFLSLTFTLRDVELHSSVSPLILIAPIIIVLFSIFADILSRHGIVATMAVYALFGGQLIILAPKAVSPEILLAAFSLFGMFVFYNLMGVCEAYFTLKNEKGYPDFFELPNKGDVAVAPTKKNEE
ncbi:MAG: hypothetical protein FWG90_07425 [Oscillospiraceae bacterium]|nr:hypothetical protein [Oscillospiraceae bacterium]